MATKKIDIIDNLVRPYLCWWLIREKESLEKINVWYSYHLQWIGNKHRLIIPPLKRLLQDHLWHFVMVHEIHWYAHTLSLSSHILYLSRLIDTLSIHLFPPIVLYIETLSLVLSSHIFSLNLHPCMFLHRHTGSEGRWTGIGSIETNHQITWWRSDHEIKRYVCPCPCQCVTPSSWQTKSRKNKWNKTLIVVIHSW